MVNPTENRIFNHGTRLPNPHAVNSRAFHDRHRYPPSAAGSSQNSPCPAQYVPSYDRRGCPHAESRRAAFKRKSTSELPAYQYDHGHYSAGSSSTFPNPRNNFQLPEFCRPQPLTSTAPYSSDNLLYVSEHRNVRRRHGDASHNSAWQSSSSNPPHQFHPLMNNHSPNAVGQWDHPLSGTRAPWIHPTGAGCSSYTTDYSLAENVSSGSNTSNHGASQYPVYPVSHYSMSRGQEAGPSRHNHRQIPRRTSSSYMNFASKDTMPFGAGSAALPQNSRPLIRDRGLRISNVAQPLFDDESLRVRWTSEVSDMINVPPYFNPLDLFDEHRNLRLDVDSMSYEELLALEESIGNVNTGLSDGCLPSCLTVSMYSSSREDLGEASCPICLEEYKDNDNLGKMKCLHVYHVSCIKDWLRIKNACPICKAPALDDTLKKN